MNTIAITKEFKQRRDRFKHFLSNDPEMPKEVKETYERTIKALDFLATATDLEILELFDHRAFDDVVKGYIKMAADNIQLSEETTQELLDEIDNLFDWVGAYKALHYNDCHT